MVFFNNVFHLKTRVINKIITRNRGLNAVGTDPPELCTFGIRELIHTQTKKQEAPGAVFFPKHPGRGAKLIKNSKFIPTNQIRWRTS